MKIFFIPDIEKIIASPESRFFKGYYWRDGKFHEKQIKTQATLPTDKNLLKKIGLRKNEKVLFIAGYYGNWAKALAKAEVMVCYSDVSRNLVNYAKKSLREKNIREYVCSDYTLIPSKSLEYDWTLSFEPIGTKQGLPIAMLRSLLNRKGGKLIVYPRVIEEIDSSKHYKSSRPLTKIAKILCKVYKADYEITKKIIEGKGQKGGELKKKHVILTIFTNNLTRKKAEFDLKLLSFIKNKKIIRISDLCNNFNTSEKKIIQSFRRIEKITKVLDRKFIKRIVIK